MGYVPPKASALIRQDLEPLLYQLYVTFDTGSRYLGPPKQPERSYQQYIDDLYGNRPFDWFFVWNYLLLGCMIALALVVIWWVL